MTVLTSSPKPVIAAKKESSANDITLNVTGVDVKGMMFRHPATVLMLDGRDCVFRSDSQPELDGSVLAEFNYDGSNPQSRVSQAHVKSNQADPLGGFKVVVELEFPQSKRVSFAEASDLPGIQKPAPVSKPAALPAPTPSPVNKTAVEPKPAPLPAPLPIPVAASSPVRFQGPAAAPVPAPTPAPQEFSLPLNINEFLASEPAPKHKDLPPIRVEDLTPMPSAPEMDLSEVEERIKATMFSEIQREVGQARSAISGEVEKALPALVAAKMEKMIREDVEKQIQIHYESSIKTLQNDVARQLENRLADSSEMRARLEGTAKNFFEEQEAQFRRAGSKAEEEIASRTAMIMKSFEESLAGLESHVSASRAEMENSMAAMQNLKKEIQEGMLFVQEALQQLRDAEKPAVEKMHVQAAAQLKEWSAQFDSLLNTSATEKAIQFSLEMERRMAPHRQRSDETIEKLGAMLQLLQGTARVQQERLNEQTLAAAANLEKQVKAFLVRLGGGA